MNPSFYERYLADPAVRAEIEREVRRARAEAFRRYLLMPLAGAMRRIATLGGATADQPKPRTAC